jgi:hypothetical protein
MNGPGSAVWWQFHGLVLREPLALSLAVSVALVIAAPMSCPPPTCHVCCRSSVRCGCSFSSPT